MKAMILAAGVGSRLDPLTRQMPKPMVPIANRPVIEHIVEKLKKHGFTEIMVNLHYLGDVIRESLGDGTRLGVQIHYAQEDQLWGDAGSVGRAAEFFRDDTFLVIGGDDISDIDLSAVLEFHKTKKALSTIALCLVDDPSEYGIVLLDDDGRITRFLEKPKGEVFSKTANTGVYFFEPSVFELIPEGVKFGFGNDVFPRILERGQPFYGFVTEAYWRDVGNIGVYRRTNFDALAGRVSLKLGGTRTPEGALVGANVQMGENVTLGENTIVGDNSVIESNVTLRETIVWPNATVKAGTHLERCIVGAGVSVQSDAAVFDGVIVNPARRGIA